MRNNIVFIMAAGNSTRIESLKIKKQFYRDTTFNKPVFLYPLETTLKMDEFQKIYVVVAKEDLNIVKQILDEFSISDDRLKLVEGGSTRAESVINAMKVAKNDNINFDTTNVLIHDACRPFVKRDDFIRLINILEDKESICYYSSVTDTMIKKDPITEVVERNNFRNIQTPQGFHLATLKTAYEVYSNLSNTDEMQIVFKVTKQFPMIHGTIRLFKLTFDEDLDFFNTMIKGDFLSSNLK